MTADDVASRMGLLVGTLDYGALAACDLVTEAVVENMALKRRVAAELGHVCRPRAILATSIATLDIDALAEASRRPGDIDVVRVNGDAFPDHLGGPLFWAARIGTAAIAQRLAHYARTRGDAHGYWRTAPLLAKLARENARLSTWKRGA